MALSDELEDLEEDLDGSEDIVGNQPGPLTDPSKSQVAALLTSAQGHISTALGLISNVGTADNSNLPSTLPAIADEVVHLAHAAVLESRRPTPNNTTIGNYLKTINRIIDIDPGGYKDRIGL